MAHGIVVEREAQILELLNRPHTTRQLANRLGMSLSSIRRHIQHLRQRGRIVAEREWPEQKYRVVEP